MHKKLLILFLFLFVVGCKKAEDSDVDRNASALEGGGDGEQGQPNKGDDADAAGDDAATEATDAKDASADAEDQAATDDADTKDAENADEAEGEQTDEQVAKRQFRGKHEITVLSKGDAPRQLLRYNFDAMKPGSLEARTEVDTQVDGQTLVVPRVVQILKIEKLDVLGDVVRVTVKSDSPKYEARVKDDPVHDMIIQSMKEMAEVGEMRFSFEMDHFGNTGNAKILSSSASTDDVQAMIANQIDQFTNGFPTEPVGKGAQWKTKTELDMGGEFKVNATVHYRVKSIDSKGAVIALRHEVSDLRHALNVEGAEEALMSGTLEGNGTMNVRFDRVMPTLDQTVLLDMKVQDANEEVAMKLKVSMKVTARD